MDNKAKVAHLKKTEVISGGHLVAKALKNDGIDTIFTLSGGNIVDIYDGCVQEGIRVIDFRHEQVAAHAADAYARQTGQTGCLVTTSGPGCCNAVVGLATALQSETPLLHISGSGSSAQYLQGTLQEFDHIKLMQGVTKWASSVKTVNRTADMVAMACRHAWGDVPGPVYLEIARDFLSQSVNLNDCVIPEANHYRFSNRVMPAQEEIDKAADILSSAKNPVVFLGSQVFNNRSHEVAKAFVKKHTLATYTNGASRGIFLQDDELLFDRTRFYALSKADVILVVGAPFDFRLDYGKTFNPQAKIIHIDQNYKVLGKNRTVTLGLVGHAGLILSAISDAISLEQEKQTQKERRQWLKNLRSLEEESFNKILPLLKSNKTPINPYRVAYEINQFLKENTIYVGDGGDVVTISAQAVRPKQPGQWMDPGPLGTLGVGTGFAIGAKLAHPDKEVICYYGDGAFSMTAFDLETANRFNVPYLAIVGNNSAMNQIRYAQIQKYGKDRSVGTLLSDMPYSQFAQMLGGYGEEVRRPEDIAGALQRGREAVRKTGKCAVINIWVDDSVWSPGTIARFNERLKQQDSLKS